MWRIYYDDGSTLDDSHGLDGIESFGVLCILHSYVAENGVVQLQILSGMPYYIFDGMEWLPSKENDIIDRLVHKLPIDQLLVGRITNNGVFKSVYEKARRDKDSMP